MNNTEVVEPVSPDWETFVREDDPEMPIVSFEFGKLKEIASYQVKVRTRNSIDWSEPNQPFVFTTSHGQRNVISVVIFVTVMLTTGDRLFGTGHIGLSLRLENYVA